MGVESLIFKRVVDNQTVYDPDTISGPVSYYVINMGAENLTNLGLYICTAKSVGDVDDPADYPPETDYQDLLTWGTRTSRGIWIAGGLIVTVPQNGGGSSTLYVTRTAGATYGTRIPIQDLAAGASITIVVNFEVPVGVPARRFFVNLVVE